MKGHPEGETAMSRFDAYDLALQAASAKVAVQRLQELQSPVDVPVAKAARPSLAGQGPGCRPCNSYLAGQRRNCGWRRAKIARRDDPKGRRGQSQFTALGISVHRALAVVTTADDLFLAQPASPAVAWPDGP
jgi:hypothetical protein